MNKPRIEVKNGIASVIDKEENVIKSFSTKDHGKSYLSAAQLYLQQNYDKLMAEEVEQMDEAYTVKLTKTKRRRDVKDDIDQPIHAVDRHYDIHDENGKKVGEVLHHYNQYGGHFYNGHIHGSNIPYDRQKITDLKQNAQAFINGVEKTKWHSKLLARRQQKEEVEQIDEAKHKLNDRVRIVGGPRKGIEGHIGEIRHGLHKGAPKTYTVFHGPHGATRVNKEQIRKIKEKVEQIDEDRASDLNAASGFGQMKYKPFDIIHQQMQEYRAKYPKNKTFVAESDGQFRGMILRDLATRTNSKSGKSHIDHLRGEGHSMKDIHDAVHHATDIHGDWPEGHGISSSDRNAFIRTVYSALGHKTVEEGVEQMDESSGDAPIDKMPHKDLADYIGQHPKWVEKNREKAEKLAHEKTEDLQEKLTSDMSLADVIRDFVHSDNKRFKGKSKEERIDMAKGAYYGMHENKIYTNIISKLEEGRHAKPTPEHVVAQILKHQDYGYKDHEYTFHDGSKLNVTPEKRDKIIKKIQSLTGPGPGKSPEARKKLYDELNTRKGFLHHTGDEPREPEKPKHPMSAQKG